MVVGFGGDDTAVVTHPVVVVGPPAVVVNPFVEVVNPFGVVVNPFVEVVNPFEEVVVNIFVVVENGFTVVVVTPRAAPVATLMPIGLRISPAFCGTAREDESTSNRKKRLAMAGVSTQVCFPALFCSLFLFLFSVFPLPLERLESIGNAKTLEALKC